MSSALVSVPFHKVLLELKSVTAVKSVHTSATKDKRIPMGDSLSSPQLGVVIGTALTSKALALTPGEASWPLFR